MPDGYGDMTLSEWEAAGCPSPPPHAYKVRRVLEIAERLGIRRMLETGYGYGRMARDVVGKFDEFSSIERDDAAYLNATREFKDDARVRLFLGDSSVLLPAIIMELDGPYLFWLDAHGADGSPVLSELEAVLSRGRAGDADVVLVDDVRRMGNEPGWPTLEAVCSAFSGRRPGWVINVERDVITAHRPTNGGA